MATQLRRPIIFRGKNIVGNFWCYGCSSPIDEFCQFWRQGIPLDHIFMMSQFWSEVERGFIDKKTVGQYVEISNYDGSTTRAFEDDIISHGGRNHNGYIVFGVFQESPGFYCAELLKQTEYHSLPPDTSPVKIIGNIHDNRKLLYRWGRV